MIDTNSIAWHNGSDSLSPPAHLGPWVIWSPGYLGPGAFGPQHIWSPGHLGPGAFGPWGIWAPGHLVPRKKKIFFAIFPILRTNMHHFLIVTDITDIFTVTDYMCLPNHKSSKRICQICQKTAKFVCFYYLQTSYLYCV